MSGKNPTTQNLNQELMYEIRVAGHLPPQFASQFRAAAITPETGGTTSLICPVPDQAALFGLLKIIRDTGLTLLSLQQITIP